MLMSVRFLIDVGSVNIFSYTPQIEFTSGDTQNLYFQLIDASLDRAEQYFNPPGRRYMPATTATLKVELLSTECEKRVLRQALQPYSQDASIWMVPILGSDNLRGTIVMNMTLTEPTRTLNFSNAKGGILRIR